MAEKIDIRTLLAKRFCSPEYCLLHEVSNSTGYGRTNSADIIYMGLWRSRGHLINGVEIKSHRNDWLRELKNPKKAEAIFQYCDRFWLAAEEKVVLNVNEIPATWGYMVAEKGKLKIVKEAPVLKPEPLSRDFLAAMLKRATVGMIHESTLIENVNAKVEQRLADKARYEKPDRYKEMHELLLEEVRLFEQKSGIRIRGWDSGRVAEAVSVVMKTDMDNIIYGLKNSKANMQHLIEVMDQEILKHEKEKESKQTA